MSLPSDYIQRAIEPVLARSLTEFPGVVLVGPRQAGKTTLLRRALTRAFGYVAMDLPDVQAAAQADPRGFLDLNPAPVVFDEIQYCPWLLPYLRERIDSHRDEPGQYVLTGSQNLLLMDQVTESLAGRVALLQLLPLSNREQEGCALAPFPWESDTIHVRSPRETPDLESAWTRLVRGSFPELVAQPARAAELWHASYIHTYLERDVRRLRQVADLSSFQSFMRTLAARSAQLLNVSDVARDLGLAVNTIRAWLSVLEASFQVVVLRPHHANIGKRLIKAPKVYFTDVGTLCYLTGVSTWQHAAHGPMAGAIFETAVFGELYKTLLSRGTQPRVAFWRTAAGREVDFIVDGDSGLVPIEAKAGATVRPRMAEGIHALRRDLGEDLHPGFVVHMGRQTLPLGSDTTAIPFGTL
ncbi:MAG: GTP-binding protein [Gemmatimonadetes bacterium]|nr:GTP-binding protein [Gemmatimonadota bacterium]